MKNKKNLSANLKSKITFGRFIINTLICFAVIGIIYISPNNYDEKSDVAFNSNLKNYNVKLQILNQDKTLVTDFLVAIADNQNKKIIGLMNLEYLDPNYGMLFTFENEEIINMWMKNTKISLDMLFIDKNNQIVNIFQNATPYSLKTISSEKEVIKVLEINGGLCQKLGIEVGQIIEVQKKFE